MSRLLEIVNATQKTVDTFKGRDFVDGKADCIQLALTHARHMGVKISIAAYGDNASAAAVLRGLGFTTLGQAMDHFFTRIHPSQVMVGDFVETPGGNGFSSIMVATGNGDAVGFHESIPFADILHPVMISGAWRIG